jgi:hypothetical protein
MYICLSCCPAEFHLALAKLPLSLTVELGYSLKHDSQQYLSLLPTPPTWVRVARLSISSSSTREMILIRSSIGDYGLYVNPKRTLEHL